MGLLDKIKNLFTDEEEILDEDDFEEVEEKKPVVEKPKIEKVKKEKIKDEIGEIEQELARTSQHQLPTFMREKIEREQRIKKVEEDIMEVSDFSLTRENKVVPVVKEVKETSSFKFPVFDDKDFETSPVKAVEPIVEKPKEEIKKVNNLYNGSKSIKKEVKKFRPTPIISPVYGVLDKNYKKEEVKSKPESPQKITRSSSKKVDFEAVRMKAYGTLVDDISNNLLCESLVDDTNVEVIDPSNLLFEFADNSKTTIANAEENYYDFGMTYEIPRQDYRITVPENNDDIKIVNHNYEEVRAEKIEVKEPVIEPLNNTVVEDAVQESDLELTEDLFSLIDAMYDERNGN